MTRRMSWPPVVAIAAMLTLLAGCTDDDSQQQEGVDEQPNHVQQSDVSAQQAVDQERLVVVEETTSIQREGASGETASSQQQGSAGEVPDHELTACGSGDGLQQAGSNRGIDGKIAFAGQIYASTSASPNVNASVGAGEDVTVEPLGSAGPDVVHGHSDLCVIDADGTGLTRLTNTPADEISPIWSPDGEKIAFLGSPGGVNVMNADGSDLAKLPWSGSAMPAASYVFSRGWAWSPDGRTFAYTSVCGMYITPADASGKLREFKLYRPDRRVASASPDQICPESPAWSPNGDQIAFTNVAEEGGDELYVMDVPREGGDHDLWKLTEDPGTSPAWSPDGSEIAFVRAGSNSAKIYKIDVRSLKETPLAEGVWPAWSPDGENIAFVGDGGAIMVMGADGSNPTTVFDVAGVQVSQPVWQPMP